MTSRMRQGREERKTGKDSPQSCGVQPGAADAMLVGGMGGRADAVLDSTAESAGRVSYPGREGRGRTPPKNNTW